MSGAERPDGSGETGLASHAVGGRSSRGHEGLGQIRGWQSRSQCISPPNSCSQPGSGLLLDPGRAQRPGPSRAGHSDGLSLLTTRPLAKKSEAWPVPGVAGLVAQALGLPETSPKGSPLYRPQIRRDQTSAHWDPHPHPYEALSAPHQPHLKRKFSKF